MARTNVKQKGALPGPSTRTCLALGAPPVSTAITSPVIRHEPTLIPSSQLSLDPTNTLPIRPTIATSNRASHHAKNPLPVHATLSLSNQPVPIQPTLSPSSQPSLNPTNFFSIQPTHSSSIQSSFRLTNPLFILPTSFYRTNPLSIQPRHQHKTWRSSRARVGAHSACLLEPKHARWYTPLGRSQNRASSLLVGSHQSPESTTTHECFTFTAADLRACIYHTIQDLHGSVIKRKSIMMKDVHYRGG